VQRDVGQSLLGSPGVGEGGLDHLEDGLLAAGHAVQRGRLGELEAERGSAQLVVGLGLGLDLWMEMRRTENGGPSATDS